MAYNKICNDYKEEGMFWEIECENCSIIFKGIGELICPECETPFSQDKEENKNTS
jgi:uncharacterized Zn finger protein (UPF0148 family)